jgi:hypothetical protein
VKNKKSGQSRKGDVTGWRPTNTFNSLSDLKTVFDSRPTGEVNEEENVVSVSNVSIMEKEMSEEQNKAQPGATVPAPPPPPPPPPPAPAVPVPATPAPVAATQPAAPAAAPAAPVAVTTVPVTAPESEPEAVQEDSLQYLMAEWLYELAVYAGDAETFDPKVIHDRLKGVMEATVSLSKGELRALLSVQANRISDAQRELLLSTWKEQSAVPAGFVDNALIVAREKIVEKMREDEEIAGYVTQLMEAKEAMMAAASELQDFGDPIRVEVHVTNSGPIDCDYLEEHTAVEQALRDAEQAKQAVCDAGVARIVAARTVDDVMSLFVGEFPVADEEEEASPKKKKKKKKRSKSSK